MPEKGLRLFIATQPLARQGCLQTLYLLKREIQREAGHRSRLREQLRILSAHTRDSLELFALLLAAWVGLEALLLDCCSLHINHCAIA